jgi:O-acetyl-ADP-ribose deacetylase (regulator of RNase III)
MKICFVSTNDAFINEIREIISNNKIVSNCIDITYYIGDVQDIDVIGKAFVSPSNSLCFMDGGIDHVLSRKMFPSIEQKLKKKVATMNKLTLIGRPYLPIGSAVAVPTQYSSCIMISAPTMFLPHDVSNTNNAYHAFMASLCMFSKYKQHVCESIDTLVCTSLCCGWGQMTPKDAAKQIYNALCDFLNNNSPTEIGFQDDPYVYMTSSKDEEQPNHYDNREIKNIF